MKRYIKAATQYDHHMAYNHGTKRFFVYYDDPNRFGDMVAQISEIHPYDDAEYAWAKIEGHQVKFYKSGKLLDKMTLPSYDDEEYESLDSYIDEMMDSVAVELINLNKNVRPVMVHY